jgi:hypothetical protein
MYILISWPAEVYREKARLGRSSRPGRRNHVSGDGTSSKFLSVNVSHHASTAAMESRTPASWRASSRSGQLRRVSSVHQLMCAIFDQTCPSAWLLAHWPYHQRKFPQPQLDLGCYHGACPHGVLYYAWVFPETIDIMCIIVSSLPWVSMESIYVHICMGSSRRWPTARELWSPDAVTHESQELVKRFLFVASCRKYLFLFAVMEAVSPLPDRISTWRRQRCCKLMYSCTDLTMSCRSGAAKFRRRGCCEADAAASMHWPNQSVAGQMLIDAKFSLPDLEKLKT